MGLFFRYKLFNFYLFVVVYTSFHTWHTWGDQYKLRYFLLDFDHWWHSSDTLKMATWSKPDIASAWPMQCAWMTSRHRENDRYWRVVGMQAVCINYNKLSKTCHDAQIDAFCDLLGVRAVARSYPRPLAGRQFYRLCCHDEGASGAS